MEIDHELAEIIKIKKILNALKAQEGHGSPNGNSNGNQTNFLQNGLQFNTTVDNSNNMNYSPFRNLSNFVPPNTNRFRATLKSEFRI